VADRTVRAVFEARVAGAQKGLRDLAGDADKAGAKVDATAKSLKDLSSVTAKPKIDLAIEDAQRRLTAVTKELGELRQLKATPEVELQIKDAQKRLRDVRTELKDLQNAKATIPVKADTGQAEKEIADLGKSGAGKSAGDAVGDDMVSGIVDALGSIPIAGAVVGVGAAIAGGILLGIKQGMQIEADRDLFGARTGLDEATAAKFGRAAGEAYANVFGDSVAANLETARTALEQGLIDPAMAEKDITRVIESLSGISQIMQTDIPETARAAGQMIKTGLADSAERAFDILVAGYQHGAGASQDLMDTLTEYPVLFQRLGLSGEDAMGLLIQGLEGGAFNADKTADALKEFQIRATDASESSAKGFELIGLNAAEMTAKIAKGGPEARAGLQEVLDGLNAIEDPVKRNTAGVALFGTQWEDMGDAIRKLDLKTAASEIGDAAGATERALKTMSDNAATQIEGARRNIEEAANGIKGALAAAFADDIEGAAKWVQANRAPLMQFFLDVMNGAIDTAGAFAEFGAAGLEAVAGIAEGMSKVLYLVPGMSDTARALGDLADGARSGATALREDLPAALDATQAKINDWAGPELMKARVHDATVAMAGDMDAFSAEVDASGGTVTINGETLTAEQALDVLVANIDGSDGTVSINGNRVPADQALSALMGAVRASTGSVTVNANTAGAEAAISNLVRYRVAEIGVRIAGITGQGGQVIGNHDGGWIQKGRHLGGWVPGSDPGYDNVLWPLNSGGRTLQQPLAGGEMVVNSKDAAFWAPVLEWMNGGGRPSSSSSAAGLDPRALASAVSAALEGARLELTGVDRITGHMSARLVGAIGRV
jgi:phage-related minor tail protein